MESRFRIDAAHRADHLTREQDVLGRDDFGQQVDAGLMIDAGVEIDVVQKQLDQQGLLHLLRQAAKPPPVVRHRAAAMRDKELQRRKVLEQVGRQALHERRRISVQVMRAGGVETLIAACADMDHRRDVVLDHLLIDRIPVPAGQRRRCPVPPGRIRVQVDPNEPVIPDASLQLRNTGLRINAGRLRKHRRPNKIVRE